MQKAAGAKRTILVLSPAYLRAVFPAPEWAAAFADDPQGLGRKLVPVRVEACKPQGLLKSIVYIDLARCTAGHCPGMQPRTGACGCPTTLRRSCSTRRGSGCG